MGTSGPHWSLELTLGAGVGGGMRLMVCQVRLPPESHVSQTPLFLEPRREGITHVL